MRSTVDVIFYRAMHRAALAKLATLSKLIKQDGAVWIVRPKGRKEITEARRCRPASAPASSTSRS